MGIFSALFGGGTKPYKSKSTQQYEQDYKGRLYDRMGPDSKALTGAEGVKAATAGYDLSPQKEAIAGYRKPRIFTESYKPYQFNFKGLPQQYQTQAYNRGVQDLRRENQGQLEQVQQAVGVRRPGLLAKTAQDMGRRFDEQTGKMATDLGLERMRMDTDLARAQQEAEAGEAYKAYGSRADLEKTNADFDMQRLGKLFDAGQGMVGTQSGLVGQERDYRDRALQMLGQLFGDAAGMQNQAAQMDAQKQAATLSALGSIAGGLPWDKIFK